MLQWGRVVREDCINKEVHIMYVISDSCISCGACADTCPMGAIAMDDSLGRYAIDGNTCIDCGSCADGCPMGAIAPGE